jgi:glycosyltransferase involved in cell wall biosynthesis
LIIVANGGRDEKYIKNLASRLKVNLKIVKGIKSGLDNKKLVGLYNKAKLFLFAPYNEPFGLVVLEAMSCGLPVVGVNEGGLRETIIDGKNGWLCSRNAKKFAETINMALDSVNKKFRIKTAESVKSWSWENSAKQMEKFFKKVVKE